MQFPRQSSQPRQGVREELLRAQDIDPQRRGETLGVAEFIRIARAVNRSALLKTDGRPLRA